MKRVVVDASIAIKWYVPEIHSEAAAKLLSSRYELIAPDLLLPEAANVIWKKTARRELTEKEGRAALAELLAVGIELFPSSRYVEAALILANATGTTVYDSLYLAVAVSTRAQLVTADRRFLDAQLRGPSATHLLWVEDLAKV
jgi:predicted nucleic acid-binding protein